MRELVIGAAAAGVLLIAIFLAPGVLRSSHSAGLAAAEEQGELARRTLHQFDASAPKIQRQFDLATLRDADYEQLVGRVSADLQRDAERLSASINQIRASDRKAGMPAGRLPTLAADAGSLRSAATAFEKFAGDNQKLLADAMRAAEAAAAKSPDAFTGPFVRGLGKMVEAHDLLVEARRLRRAFSAEQAEMVLLASRWATTRAEHDSYASQDVSKIDARMKADLAELTEAQTLAAGEVETFSEQIAARERELTTIRNELARLRGEYLTLEETGFKPGDDAAFSAYSNRLRELSGRMKALQEQEQLTQFGGMKGGAIAGDEFESGEITGGEPVAGVEMLTAQRDGAAARQQRFAHGQATLQKDLAELQAFTNATKAEAERYAKALQAAFDAVDKSKARIEEIGKQAAEVEDRALMSARAAATAFRSAATAAQSARTDAGRLQSEFDKDRKNERLKMIVGDDWPKLMNDTAEADANALVGRILSERVAALEAYRAALTVVTGMVKGAKFDKEPLDTAISTGREEAMNALSSARATLETHAQGKPTSWIQQATLGCVLLNLAELDSARKAEHLAAATTALTGAVTRRELSPYMPRELLALKLTVVGDAPPSAEPPPSDAPADQPANQPPPTGG